MTRRTEPSRRLLLGGVLTAALFAVALLPVAAQAESLHVIFPQSVSVTVVQGESMSTTVEVHALGATSCDATTVPIYVDSLYSLDAVGDVAAAQRQDMPITTDANRGSSDNCNIHDPVEAPITVTAAVGTPVGDYTSNIVYGRDANGQDLQGPPLIIHVVAPDADTLPTPQVAAPQILVLGEREAPHPTLGKTVMLTLVKGTIRIHVPGQSVQTLTGTLIVPIYTKIDATHGTVKVTVVHSAAGGLDSADAWGGAFAAFQDKGSLPITTLTLSDPFATASRHVATAARKRSSKGARLLWVNGKGNFRSKGKRASAIVRGTFWKTEDSGSATKVSVKRGLVAVRDLVKNKTVLVSAGHSYTARPVSHVARRVPVFTGRVH